MGLPKPSVAQLDWVPSNSGVRVEPSGSKKNQGWSPQEPLPAQNENWILYSIDQWIKWLEKVADALYLRTYVVGTAQQVTDGLAEYSSLQDAYDDATADGGGKIIIMNGNIAGDLNANGASGVMFEGVGYDTNLSGNITIAGSRHIMKDLRITGSLAINGQENGVECWLDGTNFTAPAPNSRNEWLIRNVKYASQSITFKQLTQPATSGSFDVYYGTDLVGNFNESITSGSLQTALRALPGLGSVTVTGSYATSFVVNFNGVESGLKNLSVQNNTLQYLQWAIVRYAKDAGSSDVTGGYIQWAPDYGGPASAQIQWNNADPAAASQAIIRTYSGMSAYVMTGSFNAGLELQLIGNPNEQAPVVYTNNLGGVPSGYLNQEQIQDYMLETSSAVVRKVSDGAMTFSSFGSNGVKRIKDDYVVTAADRGFLLLLDIEKPITLTMPAAGLGVEFTVFDGYGVADNFPVTCVRADASEKIGGVASDFIFKNPFGKQKFSSDGNDWFIA